jgi:hypothetical protein
MVSYTPASLRCDVTIDALAQAERERDEWKVNYHKLMEQTSRYQAEVERLRLVFGKENTALREEVERLKKMVEAAGINDILKRAT